LLISDPTLLYANLQQSAALSPLTLLLHFKHGQLYIHLALRIVAGVSTYLLLQTSERARRLSRRLARLSIRRYVYLLANAVISSIVYSASYGNH
jgi:hypothetical protein